MRLAMIQMMKAMIAEMAAALVFLYRLVDLGRLKPYKTFQVLLVLLAYISIVCYFDFGYYPKHGRFMNPHGWFHYYIGSKYARELGYYDLYRAVVVANAENNGELVQTRLRNLNTYGFENASTVMQNAEQYKNLFTPERWDEFTEDIRYFQSIFIPRRWPGVVEDKGYNATPTWNMVGGFLTNTVSTQSRLGMLFLLSLDMALVFIMLMLVSRAFGWRASAFTLIYVCTHFAFFMYNVNEIRGAFLRLDWVTLAVMTICLLKLNHYKTAGGLMAYAGMARIFPLVLLFGLCAKLVWDVCTTRKLNTKYIEFFAAFAVVSMILIGCSILWSGGFGLWEDFFEKIRMHDKGLSAQRTGFKYIFLNTYHGSAGKLDLFERRRVLWWTIQAAVLLASFFCVRKLEDYESLAFSYVPLFFLTAPTTYYHIGLVVPLFLFLPKIDRLPRAFGVAFLFGITICFCLFNNASFPGGLWALSYTMSWIILVFLLYVLIVSLLTPKPDFEQGGAPRRTPGFLASARTEDLSSPHCSPDQHSADTKNTKQ